MSYQAFLLALTPYVERCVLLDSPAIHRNGDLMPPVGVSGLMINLGADYHVQLAQTLEKLPVLGVGGQLTFQYFTGNSPRLYGVGNRPIHDFMRQE